jgi:spore coat polysaccharide biosynthesis predicted glycosyltransferase SpsG
MKKLHNHTKMIINFEDRGEGRKLANLVFNPIFEKQKSLSNEFYGSKYACVRDEFRIWKNEILSKNVKKILISFGGTDQNNITEKTLSIIEKSNIKNIEFVLLLGFGYMHKKMIKQKIKNLQKNNFNIILVDGSDFMAKYTRDIDFAITSNGRTVFELASMNIPILAISVNSREQNHNFVKEQNIGIKIDYEKLSYEKSLKNSLEKMLNFNNRKNYKKNLTKIDLLNGINIVVDKINYEYNLLNKSINQ